MRIKWITVAGTTLCLFCTIFSGTVFAQAKGIYITQTSLEDTKKLTYLIKRAKEVGINTFVIDYVRPSKLTDQNIQLVKDAGLHYVARIVIFPDGATRTQMKSQEIRDKKLALMKQAVALGAKEIQLDYIRYSSRERPSLENKHDVHETIKWYRKQLQAMKVPMQIDVFGITSFHEEKRIGQNPGVFSVSVDTICPMVYPSHYEPYKQYSAQPYKTVYDSLQSLKAQMQAPVKIIAYIEAHNYRYPLAKSQKFNYVNAEVNAVEDAKVDGWYFWSANNIYDHVFNMLEARNKGKLVNKRTETIGS